jgi:hypothetical protein
MRTVEGKTVVKTKTYDDVTPAHLAHLMAPLPPVLTESVAVEEKKRREVARLAREEAEDKVQPDDTRTARLRAYLHKVNELLIEQGLPCTFSTNDYYGGEYQQDAWSALAKELQPLYNVQLSTKDDTDRGESYTNFCITLNRKAPAPTPANNSKP